MSTSVALDSLPYVEQSETYKQRLLDSTAFDDEAVDDLERVAKDVIEELEYLIDAKASMTPTDFIREVRFQGRRLSG